VPIPIRTLDHNTATLYWALGAPNVLDNKCELARNPAQHARYSHLSCKHFYNWYV